MKNDILQDLKEAADEMGTTQVGLVKLCTVAFLRWVKENKIRRLPDDWAQIISEMDGRKMRYKSKEILRCGENAPDHNVRKAVKKKKGEQDE